MTSKLASHRYLPRSDKPDSHQWASINASQCGDPAPCGQSQVVKLCRRLPRGTDEWMRFHFLFFLFGIALRLHETCERNCIWTSNNSTALHSFSPHGLRQVVPTLQRTGHSKSRVPVPNQSHRDGGDVQAAGGTDVFSSFPLPSTVRASFPL